MRRPAFSLVETILAVTVLALAVAFALSVLPSSALSARRAQKRVTAANLAQSLIEHKRAEGSLVPVTASLYDVVNDSSVEYQRRLTIETVGGSDGTPLAGAFKLHVVVSWTEGSRQLEVRREAIVNRRF